MLAPPFVNPKQVTLESNAIVATGPVAFEMVTEAESVQEFASETVRNMN